MCLPSQETNGWCEENTYERLRKALVDLTKKTAERSKVNWVEVKANPGSLARAAQCSGHCATTVAHVVAGAYECYNAPGSTALPLISSCWQPLKVLSNYVED